MEYHGFTIEPNRYGWFNVPAINCWSSPTVESAKAAIDRYAAKNNLCEHGVPRAAKAPGMWLCKSSELGGSHGISTTTN